MQYTNLLLSSSGFNVLIVAIAFLGGLILGIISHKIVLDNRMDKARTKASMIIEDALRDAKANKKEMLLEAKAEIQKEKNEADQEIRERKYEVKKLEDRIALREELLSKKEESVAKESASNNDIKKDLESRLKELDSKEKYIENVKKEIENSKNQISVELERVANLTKDDAKKELCEGLIDEAKGMVAKTVRQIEEDAKNEADKKAKEIVTLAIQKCALDHCNEICVTSVELPNEEMKGRIIGREGRNIRAIEQALGVDLIIDDTPESIAISSFDPVRREVARLVMEKLILDGRIHPGRIEEIIEKVKKDVEQTIKEAGDNAAFDAGIHNLNTELVKILGRLKFRTSYGQNVLKHSLEVSYLAGIMAAELGADEKVARRGGLLHDIGKALDHETEGTHITIGVQLARKYKESEAVVHCIEAHHGNVEFKTIEAILVQVADAISSARPGARRESIETYIKRLEQLEEIANSHEGVEKSFAIQAGREIRIIVKPDVIDDAKAFYLAKDIAREIEESMDYPGQIKVHVIRESRTIDFAK